MDFPDGRAVVGDTLAVEVSDERKASVADGEPPRDGVVCDETEHVRDTLVTLADQLDADALDARHVPEFNPVETPEGTVYVVDGDAWDALADDMALDAGVRQAVRQAHVRAAEGLLDSYAPNSDARRFAAEYDAVVLPSE